VQHAVLAVSEQDCASQDCSLTVYTGFTGEDRNGVAFLTGYEIQRINQYSVSTLFNSVYQQVGFLLGVYVDGSHIALLVAMSALCRLELYLQSFSLGFVCV
jgi:hypothetical protein